MTLQVKIVTTDGITWEGSASGVRLPALHGDMGVRTGHQPVLAVLHSGNVYVEAESGQSTTVPISDGFVSVDQNVVTIVVADAPMDDWLSDEARHGAAAPVANESAR